MNQKDLVSSTRTLTFLTNTMLVIVEKCPDNAELLEELLLLMKRELIAMTDELADNDKGG